MGQVLWHTMLSLDGFIAGSDDDRGWVLALMAGSRPDHGRSGQIDGSVAGWATYAGCRKDEPERYLPHDGDVGLAQRAAGAGRIVLVADRTIHGSATSARRGMDLRVRTRESQLRDNAARASSRAVAGLPSGVNFALSAVSSSISPSFNSRSPAARL